MARKSKVSDDGGSTAAWLNTYADMVTLLLCFFVMLYASMGNGSADPSVLQQIAQSMGANPLDIAWLSEYTTIGINNFLGSGITVMPPLSEGSVEAKGKYESTLSGIAQMESSFKTYFAENEALADQIQLETTGTYIKVSFPDGVLFDKGRADIKPEAMAVLDLIANEIIAQGENNDIYIEGHTDSDPINTVRFKDNGSLSSERAWEVGRYFTAKGMDPMSIVALGYGEYRPIAPNDIESNKSKNRRVEIKIMGRAIE